MGKIPPAPSPCSSWLHHLGVTSRKDQPLGKTTTRTGHDGSANTSHTHTHVQGAGRAGRMHLLELLSLSLVLDVTPSAKNQRHPFRRGTGSRHSAATQHTDPKHPPQHLHGHGQHLPPFAGKPGMCKGTVGYSGVPGEGYLAHGGSTSWCWASQAKGWDGRAQGGAAGGAGAACTQGQGRHSSMPAQRWGRGSLPLGLGLKETGQ